MRYLETANVEKNLRQIGYDKFPGEKNRGDGGSAKKQGRFEIDQAFSVIHECANQTGDSNDKEGIGYGQGWRNIKQVNKYRNGKDGASASDQSHRNPDQ